MLRASSCSSSAPETTELAAPVEKSVEADVDLPPNHTSLRRTQHQLPLLPPGGCRMATLASLKERVFRQAFILARATVITVQVRAALELASPLDLGELALPSEGRCPATPPNEQRRADRCTSRSASLRYRAPACSIS